MNGPVASTPLGLLLIEQRQRWRRGERPLVEDYLRQQPTLQEGGEGLLDLIYNEIDLREERGEAPQLEEYLGRFPQLASQLRVQFEVHRALRPGGLTTLAEPALHYPPAGPPTV